ncbi:MAG: DNA polymerase III subunit delta' [Chloroflexi bacterium]|nr:DNA polymerase III subunit delta' [Chloroflexota bacterium]
MTSAPSSFRIPVFGHEWAQRLLRAAVIEGRTAHAYLIEGPAQVGKTTLARALAQALTCESPQADEGLGACGRCRSCRLAADEGHPDHRFIKAGGGQIKIEQVRELIREAMLSPVEGQYKVFIISSFERANPSAANALLKTLEEPTPTTRIVLTTTEISALLPTIISRCQILHLRPLSRETVAEALVNGWGAPEEQARMLAGFSEGRLGWAVDMATRPELWQANQERVAMAHGHPLARTKRGGASEACSQAGQRRRSHSYAASLVILVARCVAGAK